MEIISCGEGEIKRCYVLENSEETSGCPMSDGDVGQADKRKQCRTEDGSSCNQ